MPRDAWIIVRGSVERAQVPERPIAGLRDRAPFAALGLPATIHGASRDNDAVIPELPVTQFARNGDAHLAYQVVGDGAVDLLLVDAWVHHVELVWEVAELARFLRRLASFGRLIHFDRRGTGLSDPVPLDALPDTSPR